MPHADPDGPGRHTYRCPLRWADMDMLGHVNNVRYVDFVQEARIDFLRALSDEHGTTGLAADVVIVRHEAQYLFPLVFRPEPVMVEVWVTEVRAATYTLTFEVFDQRPDGSRTRYLLAQSVIAADPGARGDARRLTEEERAALETRLEHGTDELAPTLGDPETGPHARTHVCPVRFSDVDANGHVNNVAYFEYYQEARVALITSLGTLIARDQGGAGGEDHESVGAVVARVEVDYRAPLEHRPEPYEVLSWVARIGRSSFEVHSVIAENGEVLSRGHTVMVMINPSTGRPVALSDHHRSVLERS